MHCAKARGMSPCPEHHAHCFGRASTSTSSSSSSSSNSKRYYYKVTFNVTVQTSDPILGSYMASAKRFPSWTQSPKDFDSGDWKTKLFNEKSKAKNFRKKYKPGHTYSCYYNPEDPSDVAMRSDGGAWCVD